MNDNLINANEIYLQDIVFDIVSNDPTANDFALYNKVVDMTDINNLSAVVRILELIRLNKRIITM